MFSFFHKKQPDTALPAKNRYIQEYMKNKKKYEKDLQNVKQILNVNSSMTKAEIIELMADLKVASNELKIDENKRMAREAREQQRKANEEAFLHTIFVKEQAAKQEEEQRKEEEQRRRQETRNRRLNNLTRKYSYKTKQNLLNNAAGQRGEWRRKNPQAAYYSLENFANSKYFHPHDMYTGVSNNNASTISLNSPRSVRSRPYSPFGGTRRRKH